MHLRENDKSPERKNIEAEGGVQNKGSLKVEASKKEIIQVDGIDIQTYHWPGENDTVILFHGWESNAFRWRLLVAHLKEANYNIIACDAPGHGNSTGNILYVPLYQKTAAQLLKKYKYALE